MCGIVSVPHRAYFALVVKVEEFISFSIFANR
jgi:hypothetical protein